MGLVETKLQDPAVSMDLAAEVACLLQKGAVTVVPPLESRLEMRPILDLRILNKSVTTRKFRMLTVRALLRCVRE